MDLAEHLTDPTVHIADIIPTQANIFVRVGYFGMDRSCEDDPLASLYPVWLTRTFLLNLQSFFEDVLEISAIAAVAPTRNSGLVPFPPASRRGGKLDIWIPPLNYYSISS